MSAPSSPLRDGEQVTRLQRIRENQDPTFLSAIEKVSTACSRFSKERDGMLLTVRNATV